MEQGNFKLVTGKLNCGTGKIVYERGPVRFSVHTGIILRRIAVHADAPLGARQPEVLFGQRFRGK